MPGSAPATYAYRPDGLRYSKTTGAGSGAVAHKHLWDGQNVVAEMGATNTINTRYIRGLNLVARKIDTNLQYYQFNAHGDVQHLLDANGNMLIDYRYDMFGNQLDAVASDTNPFRYCGEYFDRETDTYYLRARNYNPWTGRFTTEDAIQFASGKLPNDQEVVDPLSLNRYTYARNNPILFVDSSGNMFMLAAAAVGLLAGGLIGGVTSYLKHGEVRWQDVAVGAAIGGVAGLTLGAATAFVAAGSATATTTAVYAGITTGLSGAATAGTAASPWLLNQFERGMQIEKMLGGMGTNFPVIDKFVLGANNIAQSVTSMLFLQLIHDQHLLTAKFPFLRILG